jgi:GTPase Era involved in 16S rRNA processing
MTNKKTQKKELEESFNNLKRHIKNLKEIDKLKEEREKINEKLKELRENKTCKTFSFKANKKQSLKFLNDVEKSKLNMSAYIKLKLGLNNLK